MPISVAGVSPNLDIQTAKKWAQGFSNLKMSLSRFLTKDLSDKALRVFLTNNDKSFSNTEEDCKRFSDWVEIYCRQYVAFCGIRNICEKIIDQFNPAQFEYIGVGRSPAPLIAYFEAKNYRTRTVPLSNFRPANDTWSITDKYMLQNNPRIDAGQKQALFSHFASSFERPLVRRKILLIDYTQTAQSLIAAQEQLSNFFHDQPTQEHIEVHALALCKGPLEMAGLQQIVDGIGAPQNPVKHPIDWYNHTQERADWRAQWHMIPLVSALTGTLEETTLASLLSSQSFDNFAEFGSYKVLSQDATLTQYRTGDGLSGYEAIIENFKNMG